MYIKSVATISAALKNPKMIFKKKDTDHVIKKVRCVGSSEKYVIITNGRSVLDERKDLCRDGRKSRYRFDDREGVRGERSQSLRFFEKERRV